MLLKKWWTIDWRIVMSEVEPRDFKGANSVLLGFGEVANLPIRRDENMVISCWTAPFRKRVRFLFTGKIWFSCMGRTHPPIRISIDKPFD